MNSENPPAVFLALRSCHWSVKAMSTRAFTHTFLRFDMYVSSWQFAGVLFFLLG